MRARLYQLVTVVAVTSILALDQQEIHHPNTELAEVAPLHLVQLLAILLAVQVQMALLLLLSGRNNVELFANPWQVERV